MFGAHEKITYHGYGGSLRGFRPEHDPDQLRDAAAVVAGDGLVAATDNVLHQGCQMTSCKELNVLPRTNERTNKIKNRSASEIQILLFTF